MASWQEAEDGVGRLFFWTGGQIGAGAYCYLSILSAIWKIMYKASKFKNDTKINGIVVSEVGCQELKQNLDELGKWVNEKLVLSNLRNIPVNLLHTLQNLTF